MKKYIFLLFLASCFCRHTTGSISDLYYEVIEDMKDLAKEIGKANDQRNTEDLVFDQLGNPVMFDNPAENIDGNWNPPNDWSAYDVSKDAKQPNIDDGDEMSKRFNIRVTARYCMPLSSCMRSRGRHRWFSCVCPGRTKCNVGRYGSRCF